MILIETDSTITLIEASLSRTWTKMQAHDTGTITAFRSEYSKKENLQRNRSMLAKLLSRRYQVISVIGSYIENFGSDKAIEVKEVTFFVVDVQDTGNLKSDLQKLGEQFDQDSIMFIPQGGERGLLIGTSKREESFPHYGVVVKYNNLQFGKDGEFMTRVGKRPYKFTNVAKDPVKLPEGVMGRMGCKAVADQDWRDVDI